MELVTQAGEQLVGEVNSVTKGKLATVTGSTERRGGVSFGTAKESQRVC